MQISGPDLFADCTADHLDTQTGTLYPLTAIEPWVDVNPADSRNIATGWQQDRWSNGGSRGLVSGISHDGGVTWSRVVIPGISLCSGGEFERASDLWLSFAMAGMHGAYVREIVGRYRIHGVSSLTTTTLDTELLRRRLQERHAPFFAAASRTP